MTLARLAASGLVGAALLAPTLGAQAPTPQQPIFRAGVDLISIDVVVVDDEGRQVATLQPGDFTVEVDGQARSVVSAQYVESGAPLVPGSSLPSATPPSARPAAANTVIFAIDTGATPPERRRQVLETANALLDRLPAADRVAVAALPWSGTGLSFTTSRALTRSALDNVTGWTPRPGRTLPISIIEAMGVERNEPEWERAVSRVCNRGDEFARLACRSSLESDARAIVSEVQARTNASTSGLEGLLRVLASVDGPKTMILFSEELQTDGARVEVSRVARAAAAARTRIHVLQPQGPAGDAGDTFMRFDRTRERQRQLEGLEYVSDWTGGDLFTIGSTQELATRLAHELSGGYLLLIDTTAADRDNRPHRISVRVEGHDVTVRARREFVADNVRAMTAVSAPTPPAPVAPAVSEPTPAPAATPEPTAAPAPTASRATRRHAPTVVGIDPLHPDRGSEETLAIVRALASALGARGFAGARSADQAAIHVELAGQRLMNGGMTALPNQTRTGQPATMLLRVLVTAGDRVTEIRGRNQGEREIVQSAADETARLIERWLDEGDEPDAAAPVAARPGAGTDVPPQDILPHIRDYVAGYEEALAGIVAEEHYVQRYSQRISPYPAPAQVSRRETRSEMGFAWFPDPGTWFGFRDVLDVDGQTVPDRQQRLEELFVDRRFPSAEQLERVAASSARFNLGPARRNFNVPTMALLVASPGNVARFAYDLRGYEMVDGRRLAIVGFRETGSPTIITRQGNDWPSRGLLWVEPASGRIWRTDLQLTARDIEMRHTTWFAFDDRLDLMVPARMRELYDYPDRADDYVETVADYTNFRRFQVNTAGPRD
ncbi:MAG: VWA domain-containing protein [Vicinamibacterales bacterium]